MFVPFAIAAVATVNAVAVTVHVLTATGQSAGGQAAVVMLTAGLAALALGVAWAAARGRAGLVGALTLILTASLAVSAMSAGILMLPTALAVFALAPMAVVRATSTPAI